MGSGSIRARFSVPSMPSSLRLNFCLPCTRLLVPIPSSFSASYQAEECLYAHLDEVEQTALDDGDTLGPQSLPLSSMGVYPAHRRAASRISFTPSPKEQSSSVFRVNGSLCGVLELLLTPSPAPCATMADI